MLSICTIIVIIVNSKLSMNFEPEFLITLGGILLLGLATDVLGRRTFLPRITLMLLFGILIGRQGLDLIPENFSHYFDIIAEMTLLIVGFLIGGKLSEIFLKQSVTKVLIISAIAAAGTTLIVSIGLLLTDVPLVIAILLGCIASATDPTAIVDIIIESNYKGPFSDLLLAIVAIDDAWGLILFSLGITIASNINGVGGVSSPLLSLTKEIGGAMAFGTMMGIPAAYLTGRIKPGQPMLTEALGIVLLCGGLAIRMGVSFLISAMTMGYIIAVFAQHHESPFHAIEEIEWPFMAIFFVLAGASLEFNAIRQVGFLGIMYILFRSVGKLSGAWVGCQVAVTDTTTGKWMGVALLPKAGLAIGMALVAANRFPEYRQTLLSVVISATIFFEIIGPIFARIALRRTEPVHKAD